ncbi:hypothetical protein [Flavobacterium sp.]|jgi:hypothetical protein|uniref:hypothetical protein n=1 Tax=Flavobacterium sp. TaxID=239 RepID=UPI0037C094F8
MNASVTRAMVGNTTSTTEFDSLTLANNGIVLQYKKKKVGEISYSELDKIYIKVYKLKPIYGFLLVLFPMLFAFLCFEYIHLNIEMSVALPPVIPTIVKINRIKKFKRFGLVIALKDSSVFRKHVSKNLKSDTVELIKEVKRKRLNYNNWALASA